MIACEIVAKVFVRFSYDFCISRKYVIRSLRTFRHAEKIISELIFNASRKAAYEP